MGKAARNRAQRAQKVIEEEQRAAVRELIGEILTLDDRSAFMQMLDAYPELVEDFAIDELSKAALSPGYGPLIARALRLIEGARVDSTAAWDAFSREGEASEAAGKELAAMQMEIEAASDRGELDEALELIDKALPLANEIGYGLSVCTLLDQRGMLLCRMSSHRRDAEIEEALDTFEAALQVAVSGEQAGRILMHRALAYSERVRGDQDENAERAIASMRDALAQLEHSDDLELCAAMKTNLAVTLIRFGREQPGSAREAAALCREALEFRNPALNADNWAYSQINLGYALQTIAGHDHLDLHEIRAVYEQVLAHADEITDIPLLGAAHHALGRMELQRARNTPKEMADAHAAGELDELFDNAAALERAAEHLTAALELASQHQDQISRARILDDLSNVLDQLGQQQQALTYARQALTLITTDSAPGLARTLAGRVGGIYSADGQWEQAADAYAQAIDASEIMLNSRLATSGRETELENAGNLHRWAAYAFARVGRLTEAAVALETGRARELQRRLETPGFESALLARVPAALRVRYETVLAEYMNTPIGSAQDAVSRRLGEAIAAIRKLPGLARFPGGPGWQEIANAVEADWPLVYVDPTPHGTLLLAVHLDGGEITPHARFAVATSSEIYMQLIVAGGELDDATPADRGSYLIGVSGQGTGHDDLAGDLDQLLPWIGEQLASPLAQLLADTGSHAATLVVCGTLNAVPLHAAPLPEAPGGVILADRYAFRYAPSALAIGAAVARATKAMQRSPWLVALADPREDLSAARPEVREIAQLFPERASTCALGSQADHQFLRRHAHKATHLHLACHACGGLFATDEAAIMLASGPLPATELTTLPKLDARLVVVSACQSAQSTIARLSNEQLSIATAMIAAGAACVIASLWTVYDLATALLMTRLYEELINEETDPPRALRVAQLWLRDLSAEHEQQFLERHPHIAAERTRRSFQERPQLAAREQDRPSGEFPYAHPEYWAPFIAVGV